jgi:HD-GYP domain-containing protein (c-di-GMP phosphodiesterase class II)
MRNRSARHNGTMGARLRLADLLGGLSLVADLGYGLDPGHAMRSCLVGVSLARKVGLSEREVAEIFYTSLLSHVGCAAFSHEMSAVFGDELMANRAAARTNFADPRDTLVTLIPESTRGMPPLARARIAAFIVARGRELGRSYCSTVCEIAKETARRIDLPEGVQSALLQVKEAWNGSGFPHGLRGEEILAPARIARVASEATLFYDLGGVDLSIHAVTRRAGSLLDPTLVDDFVVNAPGLLEDAAAGDPREAILAAEPEPVVEKHEGDLAGVAAAFGDLVDLKTPFTHGHSKEVARLAKGAAERLGFDEAATERLYVAAFLHDVGKVGVSDQLWEKPGPLTGPEWEQVRMHAYHTERILATSKALEPMARIAGMHHERLDGSGYHRGCRASEIPEPARVLAAADALQTMTEDRPYRAALDLAHAAKGLGALAKSGKLDPAAVAAVVETAGQRVHRRQALRPAGLTNREIEVLRLVARACSNREIADQLHISQRTAEHHVQNAYAKIGVTTRSAAALFAIKHDLLPTLDS